MKDLGEDYLQQAAKQLAEVGVQLWLPGCVLAIVGYHGLASDASWLQLSLSLAVSGSHSCPQSRCKQPEWLLDTVYKPIVSIDNRDKMLFMLLCLTGRNIKPNCSK